MSAQFKSMWGKVDKLSIQLSTQEMKTQTMVANSIKTPLDPWDKQIVELSSSVDQMRAKIKELKMTLDKKI